MRESPRERWKRNFPPPSPYACVHAYAGEEKGRWGREGHCEKGRRERERERERENVGERERDQKRD